MPITLTRRAAEKVRSLMQRHGAPQGSCLRVAVRKGGCSELSYLLDVTDGPRPDDETFTSHEVRVVCDPKSCLYLDGTEIDYDETLPGGGFVFRNPNARATCRCGSSFSA